MKNTTNDNITYINFPLTKTENYIAIVADTDFKKLKSSVKFNPIDKYIDNYKPEDISSVRIKYWIVFVISKDTDLNIDVYKTLLHSLGFIVLIQNENLQSLKQLNSNVLEIYVEGVYDDLFEYVMNKVSYLILGPLFCERYHSVDVHDILSIIKLEGGVRIFHGIGLVNRFADLLLNFCELLKAESTITKAKGVILFIESNPEILLDQLNEIFDSVFLYSNKTINIVWGLSTKNQQNNHISIFAIFTGITDS